MPWIERIFSTPTKSEQIELGSAVCAAIKSSKSHSYNNFDNDKPNSIRLIWCGAASSCDSHKQRRAKKGSQHTNDRIMHFAFDRFVARTSYLNDRPIPLINLKYVLVGRVVVKTSDAMAAATLISPGRIFLRNNYTMFDWMSVISFSLLPNCEKISASSLWIFNSFLSLICSIPSHCDSDVAESDACVMQKPLTIPTEFISKADDITSPHVIAENPNWMGKLLVGMIHSISWISNRTPDSQNTHT